MSTAFYERVLTASSDGTPLRQTEGDRQAQDQVARRLERAWRCQVYSFGRLCPVDWYCLRDERLVGVAELKARSHDSARHATVFLNVRKWLALSVAQAGLGVPAVYVVRFTDGLRWLPISKIDAGRVRMGGCATIHSSHTDREPVIEVPVESMATIATGE